MGDDAISYSEEIAATVRQAVSTMLQEPWDYHQRMLTGSSESIQVMYEALTKRLPGGVWEQLEAALQQWAHAMRAQYDAVLEQTHGYDRGVGAMTDLDRQIGGRRQD